MKIIPLMENNLCGEGIVSEHGLSLLVQTKKHTILADTGQSPKTWENAERLDVDLSKVDMVFLSHGHYDHSGGLMSFAEMNGTAEIYLKDSAGGDYYSNRPEGITYIGINRRILELPHLHLVEKEITLDDGISIFSGVSGKRLWPKGNQKLLMKCSKDSMEEKFIQDRFDHEQYLVIREDQKYTLISGCAHKGILNILDRFREIYGCDPDLVISGFHMKKQKYDPQDISDIENTARELREMKTVFFTGHCTGDVAYPIMKEIMGEKLGHIKELLQF